MAKASMTPAKIEEDSKPNRRAEDMSMINIMPRKPINYSVNFAMLFAFTFRIHARILIAIPLISCLICNVGQGQSTAYVNATIETMGSDGKIENGTMIVRDDKILAVGADVKIPDDARVISMSGKTIMPGLIDPYFVFKTSPASTTTRTVTFNGRTFTIPSRAPLTTGSFVRVGEYFYPYKFNFKPALRSGITAGNLVSDGRGLSAFANMTDERNPEMLFKTEGYLFAKVTNQTSFLDVIRKPLTPTPVKKPTGSSATRTVTSQPSSTSTSPRPGSSSSSATDKNKPLWDSVREGKSPLFVNVNNEAAVAYVLQFIKKHEKVKLILVATGPNIFQSLDDIKSNKNVTVVLQPGIDRVPFTTDFMNVSQMLASKQVPFAISMSLSSSQLLSSQDDPMFPLAMLVRTGLDRETALKSVTIKPAQLLGIDKTHGSLEKDKQANFLVFDGDPLQTGSRLQQVILNGKKIHEN